MKTEHCTILQLVIVISDDWAEEFGETLEYDCARARFLIEEIYNTQKNNVEKISAIDMDNTIKMLHRNINIFDNSRLELSVQNLEAMNGRLELSTLNLNTLTNDEIFCAIERIAYRYLKNKAELEKYGFVSSFVFLTCDEYTKNDVLIRAISEKYKNIEKIRKNLLD